MDNIKTEEEISIDGPFGNIYGIMTPCIQEDASTVLILAHGFRGSMEGGGRATLLADMASEYCDVVRFNFNGSQILSKQILELQTVIAYIKEKFTMKKIFLLGRSMGGAAALVTADQDPEIKGLILWATPNDLHKTFQKALGIDGYLALKEGEDLYFNDERGEFTLTSDFLFDFDKYDLVQILQRWRQRPLLLIHGDQDETVDVQQAQQAFYWAGSPKKLVVIKGADHSFTNHGNKAAKEVVDWIKERF